MKKSLSIYIFLLVLASLQVRAQVVFSSSDFLRAAYDDDAVMLLQKRYNFYKDRSYELPVIEDMELRTETNDFKLLEQEMVLRAKPVSRRVRDAQKNYNNAKLQFVSKQVNVSHNEILKERYDLIIEYYAVIKQLDILKNQEFLISDKVELLKRSYSLPNFNILDLLNAQEEYESLTRNIHQSENQSEYLLRQIKWRLPEEADFQLDTSQMINVRDIKRVMNGHNRKSKKNHVEADLLMLEMEMNQKDYDLELAKSKKGINFIQARHAYSEDNPLLRNFSVGLGMKLPSKKLNQINVVDSELDLFESQNRYMQHATYIKEKETMLRDQLNHYQLQYNLLIQQEDNSQIKHTLEEYQKTISAEPIVLIEMQELIQNKDSEKAELEIKMLQIYIDYLEVKGLLSEMPLKNYLLKGAPRI